MPVQSHSSSVFHWTIESTPVGGLGSTIIFGPGSSFTIQPSSWSLIQRKDILAANLEIRFPAAYQFANSWLTENPLAPGALVVLKVDGVARFTGKVFDHALQYSANQRLLVVTAKDRMATLKDAVVDIDLTRKRNRSGRYTLRQDAGEPSLFFSAEPGSYPPEYIRPWHSDFIVAAYCQYWTHPEAATGNIASVADNFDYTVTVTTVLNHTLLMGAFYRIYFKTTGDLYTGTWICKVTGVNTLQVWTTFLGTATGTYHLCDSNDWTWKRIPASEYQVAYDIGAIFFRKDPIKFVGDVGDTVREITDIRNDIFADFVYFDESDDSTMVSNILRAAFEVPEASGGLNWTEGVDYEIVDETTQDILSGMKWNTNLGDGDAISFVQNLYDNPEIGLIDSYWIRDFRGQGKVQAKLIQQDADEAIDVDLIFNAAFPSPLSNIYTRIVLVNNEPTRENLARDKDMFTDIFEVNDGITYPVWGPGGVNYVVWAPSMTGKFLLDDVNEEIGYLCDNSVNTSFGYCRICPWGNWVGTKGLQQMPMDIPFFRTDLGEVKNIDLIHINCRWTFTAEGDYDEAQKRLYDSITKQVAGRIVRIDRNQHFTVEYYSDLASDNPIEEALWFPIHQELFLAEVDPTSGPDSWITVQDINIEARFLRVIINNPMFFKVGESGNLSGQLDVMGMLWWMTEFQVYGGGKIQLDATGNPPEVVFTEDPYDPRRCIPGIDGELIDMYRPTLLEITEAMGLKYRTFVLETTEVWDFSELAHVSGAIVSVANVGGFAELTVAMGADDIHVNDFILVTDTTNYNGTWEVLAVAPLAGTVKITAPYVANDSGFWSNAPNVSVGYKYLATMLDAVSKDNEWEVRIDPRPDIFIGSVIYSSKLNPDRKFTVLGMRLEMAGEQLSQYIMLSDFVTCSGGEGTGCI